MFVVRWKKCCYALGDFKRLFYKGFNSKNYDGGILYQYHQNRGYVAKQERLYKISLLM